MRRLRTPEDIQALPNYLGKVDPAITPLRRILDYYYIAPFDIQCALCGQRHMDGCIVELENGRVTNIGHICGDRFGERFGEEQRKHSESQRRPELLRKLADGQNKISGIQFQLEALRYKADVVARRQVNFKNTFPDIASELSRRAVGNDARVFESIELTAEEIDEAAAANPFRKRDELRIRLEFRGTIQGYKFAAANWSLNDGLRKIFVEANTFVELQLRPMQMRDLTKWSNWCDDFDDAVGRVASSVQEGNEFFSKENFRLFDLFPASIDTRNKLKMFNVTSLDAIATKQGVTPVTAAPASNRIRTSVTPHQVLTSRQRQRLIGDKKRLR